ncbi:battenin [Denticeps clupeoides]|uniref:Battenin n=1 Tax=Denticeps clupeoides TaxID=299321 RepID=A0AAY4BFH1_9TELE|nr:battenin [Denticeps clupeoides]
MDASTNPAVINATDGDLVPTPDDRGSPKTRNLLGFGLLGLCNNLAYVVMLSAAHDILKKQGAENRTLSDSATENASLPQHNSSGPYDCNPVSTAAVLLADILPTVLIKISAPFFIHKVPYGLRVLVCVASAAVSFLLVSFSGSVWMSLMGVVFASVSSGLGELSFLSIMVFFSWHVLNGWGFGTGAAGVGGALLYSLFTQVGLSPQVTLLTMLVFPVVMALSYFLCLEFPTSFPQFREGGGLSAGSERQPLMIEDVEEEEGPGQEPKYSGVLTFKEKLLVLKELLRFIVPLGLVYFAEYFINQGLLELLYFPDFFLSHAEQYRWYQVLYQVGVLVSRSSLCCIKIRKIWLLVCLQVANAVLLFLSVYWQLLPSAWAVFAIVSYEGLLGGAAYINTFHLIHEEMGDRQKEFAMAAASVGDSLGIALSAAAAFPVHRYFCSL